MGEFTHIPEELAQSLRKQTESSAKRIKESEEFIKNDSEETAERDAKNADLNLALDRMVERQKALEDRWAENGSKDKKTDEAA